MRKLLGSLLLALYTTVALGQVKTASANSWQTVFFDSPTVALPKLTAAAIQHSAQLQSMEVGKAISEQDLKIVKRQILGGVGVVGNYTYGNQGTIGAYNPNAPGFERGRNAGLYAAGVSVALPLVQVLSRNTLIKKEQLNYQRNELTRKEQENQLRQQVIQLYQNVVLAKKLLTLQQESYVTVQTNYRLAEKQFRQGQLTLPELSEATNQLNQSAMSQETARNQYDTSFMILEEVVGTTISSLMQTP